MPAIGYDHPDQSHFNSRHFWEVGALQPKLLTGWLGRYLDRVGTPDNPLQGLSLDGELSPALATARMPVAAISSPGDYDFWAPGVWGDVEDWMLEAFPSIGAAHAGEPRPGDARGGPDRHPVRAPARSSSLPFAGGQAPEPGRLPAGRRLGLPEAARGARGDARRRACRCAASSLSAPGRLRHPRQPAGEPRRRASRRRRELLAFQRDLEARGLADRVLIQVWSEFGRRAEENGSDGTDHGAAGVGFLIGTRARGQMVGEFPGLDRLDEDGNLRATSDFRAVYCSLLEQWLSPRRGRGDPGGRALPAAGARQVR